MTENTNKIMRGIVELYAKRIYGKLRSDQVVIGRTKAQHAFWRPLELASDLRELEAIEKIYQRYDGDSMDLPWNAEVRDLQADLAGSEN